MSEHQAPSPPSLLRRLAALLYDTLLVIPLVGVTVALASALEMWLLGVSEGGDYYQMNPHIVQLLSIACVAIFFTLFWRKGGQTLGMQAWRIKLVDGSGNTPGTARCLLRCAAALASLLPAGLGYWWWLVDKQGRYWHDHLSCTHLELLPKQKKAS